MSRFIKVLFLYNESVIQPRGRKPRNELKRDGEIIVEIPDLTGKQAPVALKASGRWHDTGEPWSADYRWWREELWVSVNTDTSGAPLGRSRGCTDWDWPHIPGVIDLRFRRHNEDCDLGYHGPFPAKTKAETRADIQAWAKRHAIIEGRPYRATYERCYEICTFGVAGNHGGTAVVSTAARANSRKFSLLERDRALAEGARVAEARGDTKPMTVNGDVDWEVVMPAVLTTPSGNQAYRVHLYTVVRVPVDVAGASSQVDAIAQAERSVDLHRDFRQHDAEFAEESRIAIDQADEIKEANLDLRETLAKGEIPDLDGFWTHLQRKFGGDAGRRVAYVQAAKAIIDGFYLRPDKEVRRVGGGVVIDASVGSEASYVSRGLRRISTYSDRRVATLFQGLRAFARKSGFAQLAADCNNGNIVRDEYASREKLLLSGLEVTRFNDKWQFKFASQVGAALEIFISEFGAEHLASRAN
ncbi:hypothetical protein [Paraburkholderia domus]|uniref:hypothetical protein n=1 Tax=Paraburkholderia domus TaxID=2793075 RepID=UPI001911AF86|nr:hypothetical protein [Paraburkholderia domus]MBK5064862.1 hypothetical protein [Burkholderia sp. R-70199]CAE6967717.1 hypothetical protein R70199_07876 [Paraburkholderia domus]